MDFSPLVAACPLAAQNALLVGQPLPAAEAVLEVPQLDSPDKLAGPGSVEPARAHQLHEYRCPPPVAANVEHAADLHEVFEVAYVFQQLVHVAGAELVRSFGWDIELFSPLGRQAKQTAVGEVQVDALDAAGGGGADADVVGRVAGHVLEHKPAGFPVKGSGCVSLACGPADGSDPPDLLGGGDGCGNSAGFRRLGHRGIFGQFGSAQAQARQNRASEQG